MLLDFSKIHKTVTGLSARVNECTKYGDILKKSA